MHFKLIPKLFSGVRGYKVLKIRWFQKFLFVLFFVVSIAFFLHFREVRIDHLEIDTIAKKYVVAQVAFDFSDLETTRMLREESLKDIGLIYYFDDEEIIKVEHQIQDELVHHSKWREELPSLTFDDLIKANNAIRDTLVSIEFTDARTARKLEMMGISSTKFLPCKMEGESGHCLKSVWEKIQEEVFPTKMNQADRFIFEKYRNYAWNLKEDFNLRHGLRRQVKDHTPIRMTHVEAGSRIINAGDKVTSRHLNMLQEMKRVLTEEKHALTPLTIFGSMIFAVILILLGVIYFYKFHLSILTSFSKIALIAVVILLTLSIAKLTEFVLLQRPFSWVEACRFPTYLLFPSVVLSILVDRSVALVISGFIAILLGVTLAMESHDFDIMNLATAVLGIVWTKGVRKRKEIFAICAKAGLCSLPIVFTLNLLENRLWSRHMFYDCLSSVFFISIMAIIIIALVPLLESAFGIVTDMTLMEAADPNHPLLRRLSLEASGTYQHSLGVGTIAEEAALSIGANALLCRVGALYHDIGKIIQPSYFTENLQEGFNMHQLLTPLESAQVIIQHVTEGIKLAENAHLPAPIIDIIREHHGTTLVYYFYYMQLEQRHGNCLGMEEVFFRYPGPTPQSRESAIVMIADSIEAAFRCHDTMNEKGISDLIEEIVVDKIREHQLDTSGLTFDDLEAIKKAISRSLMAINHARPKYPFKTPPSIAPSSKQTLQQVFV